MRQFLLVGLTAVLYNLRSIPIDSIGSVIQIWPIVFLCLIPLMYLMRKDMTERVHLVDMYVTLAFIFMLSILCISIKIIPTAAFFAGVFLGIFFAVARLSCHPLLKGSLTWCIFMGALWVLSFRIVSSSFGTFFLLSTPLASAPQIIQPIRFFGQCSLEFLVVGINAALACLFLGERKPAAVFGCLTTLWIIASLILFYNHPAPSTSVRVGLGDSSVFTDSSLFIDNDRTSTPADILVFPEQAVEMKPI